MIAGISGAEKNQMKADLTRLHFIYFQVKFSDKDRICRRLGLQQMFISGVDTINNNETQ